MDKETITIIILAIILLALIFFVIKNMGEPISERIYLVNTYLYIYGGLLVIILVCALMDKFNILQMLNPTLLLIIFITSMISIVGLMLIPTENQIFKHIFFVLFLFSISVIVLQWYKIALSNNSLYSVLLTLGLIIIALTVFAYTQPLDAFNSWGSYLMIGLCGLIIFQFFDILFGSTEGLLSRDRIYGWITVILFSGFILYDTQRIRKNAIMATELCVSKNQFECADYPTESLALILDFINLFAGVIRIS